jgi:hypothetical protein
LARQLDLDDAPVMGLASLVGAGVVAASSAAEPAGSALLVGLPSAGPSPGQTATSAAGSDKGLEGDVQVKSGGPGGQPDATRRARRSRRAGRVISSGSGPWASTHSAAWSRAFRAV